MKTYWHKYNFFITVILCIVSWYLLLQADLLFSNFIPLHRGFLGPTPWANFDGALYLIISKFNYGLYQQAFFPLFPLLIYLLKPIFFVRNIAAFFIVYVSFLTAIYFFMKTALIDMPKKNAIWALVFLLAFPTSFFLRSIYTESLFLALSLGSFYFMRKEKFLSAALLAGFATATRIGGIFLFIALVIELFVWRKRHPVSIGRQLYEYIGYSMLSLSGFMIYSGYLWYKYKDPLLFAHVQFAFGANRTSDRIILLPQVFFRYIKIFLTVSPRSHDFLVALVEFISFIIVGSMLIIFWKKIRLSYLIYSIFVLLFPTFTGTLSSMPRYVLVIFPFFLLLGNLRSFWIKITLASISCIMLLVLTIFFLRGYFIS